jgi:hypothetical protein
MSPSPQQAVGGEDAAATVTLRPEKLQSEIKNQRAKIKNDEKGSHLCARDPYHRRSFIWLLPPAFSL